ncbi:MAG: tetratricopeptide repeat protein [Blastochloris sp.]|nr:tetratricopeptide repeat protein [Blastochloris sp.]
MTEQDPAHQSITGDYNAQVSGSGSATVNVYQSVIPRAVDTNTLAAAQAQRDAIPHDQIPPIAVLIPSSVMPFHANPAFVGRQDVLRQVAQQLRAPTILGPTIVITGMGGIGKTQLASEIVHRYGSFFGGGVFWLSCADPATLPEEIAACGARRLVDWRPDYLSLSQEEQVQLVLSAWQSPLPRLLIFDNCEDPTLLNQWRPTTGGCAMVVTSRYATWDLIMGVAVHPLEVLQRDESMALLRQFRPDLAEDEPILDALVQELGKLPLALHLAGSYLRHMQYAVTLSEYLTQLQAPELLSHPSLQGWGLDVGRSPTQHEQHVARTFAISYQQLDHTVPQDRVAQQTLAYMAAGAPGELMPRAVLQTILQKKKETPARHEQEAVLRRLIDLGLLDQTMNGELRLHRLLAAFVQEYVTHEDAVTVLAQALVTIAAQHEEQGYPKRITTVHPHFRHISQTLMHTEHSDAAQARVCHRMAKYCELVGDYDTARTCYERALAIREQLLGIHPDTATTLDSLAGVYSSLGNYARARQLYERALIIWEQIAHHPDSALTLNNLAILLQRQGDYTTARTFYERALTIREQLLGPNDRETADSLESLAELLRTIGDSTTAYRLCKRALAIREQICGPHHRETANTLNNLAGFLHMQGHYTDARPLYDRSLAIHEQAYGSFHPRTAQILNNLAKLLVDQGHHTEAQSLYERTLAIHEQFDGPDHPDTARSLNNLAKVLADQGNYVKARPLYERALAIRERIPGPDHPDTATTINNLAMLYYYQGEYTAARPLFERGLAISEKKFGPEHLSTARHLHNLAGLIYAQGDQTRAIQLEQRALHIAEQRLEPTHPDIEHYYTTLASYILRL